MREAARLYASAGNGAIYYGLGVTEHSQGSTMVLGIANLAMATGNLGREGTRCQSTARAKQCAGLVRHGFLPARAARLSPHLGPRAVRALFEERWGVELLPDPGYRIPNMFDAAVSGEFKALYVQGEDVAQSDPDTQHVEAALSSLECMIVQDLFLNETAKFAHVFLPGFVVPGKKRHLHECRTADLAGAQGDAATRRQRRLGKLPSAWPKPWGTPWTTAIRARSWPRLRR